MESAKVKYHILIYWATNGKRGMGWRAEVIDVEKSVFVLEVWSHNAGLAQSAAEAYCREMGKPYIVEKTTKKRGWIGNNNFSQ